jgi:hypothetical protein
MESTASASNFTSDSASNFISDSAPAASKSVLNLDYATIFIIIWSLIACIVKQEENSLDYKRSINNYHLMSKEAILSHLTEHFIEQYGLRDHISNIQKINQFGMLVNTFYPQVKNKDIKEYFSECNNLKERLNYVKEIFDLI